jgi:hypothetical protein
MMNIEIVYVNDYGSHWKPQAIVRNASVPTRVELQWPDGQVAQVFYSDSCIAFPEVAEEYYRWLLDTFDPNYRYQSGYGQYEANEAIERKIQRMQKLYPNVTSV